LGNGELSAKYAEFGKTMAMLGNVHGDYFQTNMDPRYGSRRRVEITLAIVLIVAAGLKAYQILTGSGLVLAGFLHNKVFFAILVQAEFILALWMWVGSFPRTRFVLTTICFSVFAIAALYEAARGLASCGCFGAAKVSPKITAAFDIVAVVALWSTRPKSGVGGMISRRRIYLVLGICAVLSGAFWVVFSLSTHRASKEVQADDLVILEPQAWLNKPLAIMEDIDSAEQLRTGRWLLILYHYDCDNCLKAIPAYIALANSISRAKPSNPRIAFIVMPPVAPVGQDPIPDSPNYSHLILRPIHDWFATTPVVVAIDNGIVLFAADGERAILPPLIPEWR
jgi:hypothetical protein